MDQDFQFASHPIQSEEAPWPASTTLIPKRVRTGAMGRPAKPPLFLAEGGRHPVVPLAVRDREEGLLVAARAGDADAFAALVGPCTGMLRQVALGILRNEEDAQDAFQEALLRIYLDLHRFNGTCKFSTWAYRICVNRALMVLRSRKRRREEAMEVLLPCHDRYGSRQMGAPEETLQEAPVAFARLEQLHVRTEVQKGLRKLTPKQLEVFLLKDMRGWKARELAVHIGVSLDVVRQRLHRARLGMREHLGTYGTHAFLPLGMAQAVSCVDERS